MSTSRRGGCSSLESVRPYWIELSMGACATRSRRVSDRRARPSSSAGRGGTSSRRRSAAGVGSIRRVVPQPGTAARGARSSASRRRGPAEDSASPDAVDHERRRRGERQPSGVDGHQPGPPGSGRRAGLAIRHERRRPVRPACPSTPGAARLNAPRHVVTAGSGGTPGDVVGMDDLERRSGAGATARTIVSTGSSRRGTRWPTNRLPTWRAEAALEDEGRADDARTRQLGLPCRRGRRGLVPRAPSATSTSTPACRRSARTRRRSVPARRGE